MCRLQRRMLTVELFQNYVIDCLKCLSTMPKPRSLTISWHSKAEMYNGIHKFLIICSAFILPCYLKVPLNASFLCLLQRWTHTVRLLQNWNRSPKVPQFCVVCKDGRAFFWCHISALLWTSQYPLNNLCRGLIKERFLPHYLDIRHAV